MDCQLYIRTMNHSHSSLDLSSSPGWHILGELELAVSPDAGHSARKWLATILSPLKLQPDFMIKVLESAQEAVTRARQSETVMKFEHTHLFFFALEYPASNGQAWGFFRIEKIDHPEAVSSPNHAIEFYLYPEG